MPVTNKNLEINDFVVKLKNFILYGKHNMNIYQQKVFLYCLSQATYNKFQDEYIEVKVASLSEATDLSKYKLTETINNIKKLLECRFINDNYNKGISSGINIYSDFSYNHEQDCFNIAFNPKIVPDLKDFTTGFFTQFKVKELLMFRNIHAQRLYTYCKAYIGQHNTDTIELTVREIREFLGLEKKMTRFSDFDQIVIQNFIKEVKEHTEYDIALTPTKVRRKIYSYIITLTPPQITVVNDNLRYKNHNIDDFILEKLINNGVNQSYAKSAVKKYSQGRVEYALELTADKPPGEEKGKLINYFLEGGIEKLEEKILLEDTTLKEPSQNVKSEIDHEQVMKDLEASLTPEQKLTAQQMIKSFKMKTF